MHLFLNLVALRRKKIKLIATQMARKKLYAVT